MNNNKKIKKNKVLKEYVNVLCTQQNISKHLLKEMDLAELDHWAHLHNNLIQLL